jgi:hypothetical protein
MCDTLCDDGRWAVLLVSRQLRQGLRLLHVVLLHVLGLLWELGVQLSLLPWHAVGLTHRTLTKAQTPTDMHPWFHRLWQWLLGYIRWLQGC